MLPRALVPCPSFGEILTLFIFRFLNPVSLVWKSEEGWCCEVVDDGNGVVVLNNFRATRSVLEFWLSMDPPQFFWQLSPVLKLFPFPPHPPYLKIEHLYNFTKVGDEIRQN